MYARVLFSTHAFIVRTVRLNNLMSGRMCVCLLLLHVLIVLPTRGNISDLRKGVHALIVLTTSSTLNQVSIYFVLEYFRCVSSICSLGMDLEPWFIWQ